MSIHRGAGVTGSPTLTSSFSFTVAVASKQSSMMQGRKRASRVVKIGGSSLTSTAMDKSATTREPDGNTLIQWPGDYFSTPAVRPAWTCFWNRMYTTSTGTSAITRPANNAVQSPR